MIIRFLNISFLIGMLSAISCSSSRTEVIEDKKEIVKVVEKEKPIIDDKKDPIESGIPVLGHGGDSDFKTIPVPALLDEGMEWEFQEDLSDDFEYTFEPSTTKTNFGNNKWYNFYHANWPGPKPTIWKHENVSVSDGDLQIKTTRKNGEMLTFKSGSNSFTKKATRLGCVTSNKRVLYPVYVEARVKVADAFFASDIWMLSPDDTQEIDILEAYGAQNPRNGQSWFSQRAHLSHHVFIRKPFADYQPKDASTWYKDPTGEYPFWSGKWVRTGVYWKSPTHLEYYLNGKLIKTLDHIDNKDGKDGIDPLAYTSPTKDKATRTGLSKEMDIIINTEVQSWNGAKDRLPTNKEIKDVEKHTFRVDWIRIFKPTEKK